MCQGKTYINKTFLPLNRSLREISSGGNPKCNDKSEGNDSPTSIASTSRNDDDDDERSKKTPPARMGRSDDKEDAIFMVIKGDVVKLYIVGLWSNVNVAKASNCFEASGGDY